MPLYKYKCSECGEVFTEIQNLDETAPECPECGNDQTDKMLSNVNLRFKGEGFYRTDYRKSAKEDKNEETEE